MIALILAGAAFMTLSMGYIGLPRQLAEFVGGLNLSPGMLIVALALFYVVLGCFLDGISTIVLTMGVVLPIIQAAGIDPVWFGIFLVITVETAQITPPVGFNLFVLQSMTGKEITYLARVCAPYFSLMVLLLVTLWYFPGLATWLPSHM
jgi:TRAP-type C4-dicarboxylate transport system permease large subunit